MFATQMKNTNPTKFQLRQNEKIQIDFSLLETFYNNLIDTSIRPQILKFLQFQDKVDIKQNQEKYGQQLKVSHKSNDKQGIAYFGNQSKRSIIFKFPKNHHEYLGSKILHVQPGSKINYFQISETLKNTINNTNIFIKSSETRSQQKESLQKLNHFLYEEQALFFLLKGSLQIHKKIPQNKEKDKQFRWKIDKIGSADSNHRITQNDFMMTQIESNQNIVQLLSTQNNQIKTQQLEMSFNRKRINSSQQKNLKKQWKRFSQVKQHSFFCLHNYKSFNNLDSFENIKIIPRSSIILAKISVNPLYGYNYLKDQHKKFTTISSFLSSKKQNDIQKLKYLKSVIDSFTQENVRRDTIISLQGRKNEKIYIVDEQGEIKLSKNILFTQNQNVNGFKKLQILNFRGKTLINGQNYLIDSKNIINILKSNSFLKQYHKKGLEIKQSQNHHNDNQDQKSNQNKKQSQRIINQLNSRQVLQLEDQVFLSKKQKKNNRHADQHEKILFGKSQKAFLQFSLPKLNCSNFTIKVNSAYATVYSIDIKKFQQLATQSMKKVLTKNYQAFYITLMRNSLEKLQLFQRKVEVQMKKKKEEIINYAALNSIEKLNIFSPELKKQLNFNLSPTKLSFQHKKQFKGLKRNDLLFKQGEMIQKKIQILDKASPKKEDKKILTAKFKKKIENLIVQNLANINTINLQGKTEHQKDNIIAQLNKLYVGNLSDILNAQRLKKQKYHMIFDGKTQNSQQKDMKKSKSARNVNQKDIFVNPDVFDPSKNKFMKINLLRKGHPSVKDNNNFLKGVQISQFTENIKANIGYRINETNKIKEQFLRIQSKCESCKCYEDLDSYRNLSDYKSSRPGTTCQHRGSSHDVKYHTMKIGVNWKTKYSHFNKVESKTAYNPKQMNDKMQKMIQDQQPFEKVYNKIKVLKQRSLQKFKFNQHLHRKGKDIRSRKERKKSLPLLL